MINTTEQRTLVAQGQRKSKTVWTAVKLRPRADRELPTRIPPGAVGRAFPRLASERRAYSDEERACVADMLAKLRAGADIRPAKVLRACESIAEETFDQELKLNIVADRLLDELAD